MTLKKLFGWFLLILLIVGLIALLSFAYGFVVVLVALVITLLIAGIAYLAVSLINGGF